MRFALTETGLQIFQQVLTPSKCGSICARLQPGGTLIAGFVGGHPTSGTPYLTCAEIWGNKMLGEKALIADGIDPRPIIRWAGSKKRLLPVMAGLFPAFTGEYLEPFAGSACVFFRLRPKRSRLNDLNAELINFYKVAADKAEDVYDNFREIPRSREAYYETRKIYYEIDDELDRASAFLYLNRNCFNGIYRVNKDGHFNVPFSDSRVAPYPTRDEFLSAASTLRSAQLYCSDFEQFCEKNCQKGDFVYLDPPYYIPRVRIFREYDKRDFTEEDTARLVQTLDMIDARGALFLLSYPKGELSAHLSKRWNAKEIKAMRSVAGSASARRSETEVLVTNYHV